MADPLPSPLRDVLLRVREPELPVAVIAHRGDSQNAPENTLAAFLAAREGGAELIEFDVHLSADGDVMVIHDDKVDRTTDGRGEVRLLRTAELRELSAGAWFADRYAGEQIPLLDEVLDLCRGHAVPMIEVKVKRKRAPDAGQRIAALLRRHGMVEKAIVICRELERVVELREASPATPLSTLTITKRQARAALRTSGVSGVDCYWKSLSQSLVHELRQASLFLTPWTVNRPRDWERLIMIGCEGIITDCPLLMRDRLESLELDRLLSPEVRNGHLDLDMELEPGGLSPEEMLREDASESDEFPPLSPS